MDQIVPHLSDAIKIGPIAAPFVEEGVGRAGEKLSQIRDAIDVANNAISSVNCSVSDAIAWIDEVIERLVEQSGEEGGEKLSEIRDALDVAENAISSANSSVGEALAWIDEAGLDFEDVSQILVSLETVQVELEISEERLGRILASLD
jgi:hypothetical protein